MRRFVCAICIVVTAVLSLGTTTTAAEVTFTLNTTFLTSDSGQYSLDVSVSGDNAGLAGYDVELLNIDSFEHDPPVALFSGFRIAGFTVFESGPVNGKFFAGQNTSSPSTEVFGLAQLGTTPNWPTNPNVDSPTDWSGTLVTGTFSSSVAPTFGSEVNATVFDVEGAGTTIGSISASILPNGTSPADFNEDGSVDGVDFLIWQNGSAGSGGGTHTNGDANSDGEVDGADFLIWQEMLFRTNDSGINIDGPVVITLIENIENDSPSADGNGDGVVDGVDFLIWQNHFGDVGSSPGDFNQDGLTDGVDFLLWQNQFGTGTGSAAVPEPSALALSLLVLISFALGNSGKR